MITGFEAMFRSVGSWTPRITFWLVDYVCQGRLLRISNGRSSSVIRAATTTLGMDLLEDDGYDGGALFGVN